MKKKILLSVFAIVGIMAANKSFAQYENHDKYDDRIKTRNGIRQERIYDIKDIRYDQERVTYLLNKIDLKKGELHIDLVRHDMSEYRDDQLQLQQLYVRLANARADLAKNTREVYGNRTAARF
jgi:hypothetical protein